MTTAKPNQVNETTADILAGRSYPAIVHSNPVTLVVGRPASGVLPAKSRLPEPSVVAFPPSLADGASSAHLASSEPLVPASATTDPLPSFLGGAASAGAATSLRAPPSSRELPASTPGA